MTEVAPAQCLACTRLDRSITDDHGLVLPNRCTAYPDGRGIPYQIAMVLVDHRTPFGGERDGLLFDQASGRAAKEAFRQWEKAAAALDEIRHGSG